MYIYIFNSVTNQADAQRAPSTITKILNQIFHIRCIPSYVYPLPRGARDQQNELLA